MFGIEKDYRKLFKQAYDSLYKDKEPPDTIDIGGVKYKKVEYTQSFYDKLWGLLKTKIDNRIECDYMVDQVMDLIKEQIPPPIENRLRSAFISCYNQAIEVINRRIFNDPM